MRNLHIIFVSVLLACTLGWADEPHSDIPAFSGIVQYVSGTVTQTLASGKSHTSEYKDVIRAGDHLNLEKGAIVKIITANYCVVVSYGGILEAPSDPLGAWKSTGSVRWICSEDRTQTVQLGGRELTIVSGELMFDGQQLLIEKNRVANGPNALAVGPMLEWRDNTWKPMDHQPTPREKYLWRQQFDPPQESSDKNLTSPERETSQRYYLQLNPFGRGALWHADPNFSIDGGRTFGIRLLAGFKSSSTHGWLYGFGHDEMRNAYADENKGGSSYVQGVIPPTSLELEGEHLYFGYRWNFPQSYSFYALAGLGEYRYKIHYSNFNGPGVNVNVHYIPLSLIGGFEKIFFANSWIGLFVSGEFKIARSITSTKTEPLDNNNTGGSYPKGKEADPITLASGTIWIGPVIQLE